MSAISFRDFHFKMNTKLIMTGSAGFMALLGLLVTFQPHDVLLYFGMYPEGVMPVILQVMGALYLGFGMANWMARGILMGGIYAKPLALGNFLHFFAGAMALLKSSSFAGQPEIVWLLTAVYGLSAVMFGVITFRHPLQKSAKLN